MDLNPATTAVVNIHWQNDIVSPQGRFAPTFSADATRTGVAGRTAELLTAVRRAGATVVFTRVCFRPGYPDLVGNGPLLAGCQAAGALVDGEWGAQLLDELTPQDGDLVVSHRRISGLWGSDLDTILRARNITDVLLTGVATNFSVLNTAFDAVNAGYRTTVVHDCCSAAEQAIHDVAVHTIEVIGFSTTAADVVAALGGRPVSHATPAADGWQAFQNFERDGWNAVAAVYADLVDALGLTTGPAGAAILNAAGLHPGQRVADVATGPGFLAGLAAERQLDVIGIDIAPAMIDEARRRHPGITFEVGAGEELPLADGCLDGIVSAWGLPHFADHQRVFAEARHVLRPGGRLAFGTWRPPPGNEFFAVLLGALGPHAAAVAELPAGPDMFRYADGSIAEADLTANGFENIRCHDVAFPIHLPNGGEDLVRFLRSGSVRSQAIYLAQPTSTRARIEEQLRSLLRRITAGRDDPYLRLEATVISAVRRAGDAGR